MIGTGQCSSILHIDVWTVNWQRGPFTSIFLLHSFTISLPFIVLLLHHFVSYISLFYSPNSYPICLLYLFPSSSYLLSSFITKSVFSYFSLFVISLLCILLLLLLFSLFNFIFYLSYSTSFSLFILLLMSPLFPTYSILIFCISSFSIILLTFPFYSLWLNFGPYLSILSVFIQRCLIILYLC